MCCCLSKEWIMPITLESDAEKNAESYMTLWNPFYEMKKRNKTKNETKQKCMMQIDDIEIEKK